MYAYLLKNFVKIKSEKIVNYNWNFCREHLSIAGSIHAFQRDTDETLSRIKVSTVYQSSSRSAQGLANPQGFIFFKHPKLAFGVCFKKFEGVFVFFHIFYFFKDYFFLSIIHA